MVMDGIHSGAITALSSSEDGKIIVSGGSDDVKRHTVELVDVYVDCGSISAFIAAS